MQFDLNNFTTIKPNPVAGRKKVTVPLVSITKTGFSFNSYICNNFNVIKRFVQVKVDVSRGKLAFIFSDERQLGSYKMNIPKKGEMFSGTASTAAHSVIVFLNRETDLINTEVYRYRFKAEIGEAQSVIMVDLKDPYQKSKKSKQRGAHHDD